MSGVKKIIHIDMDYFFAQIEEKENSYLADKPFAVGGTNPKRGVISTCNYIAREYGIRSAMPTAIALEKCPQLILLNTNMEKYKKVSNDIRKIFYSITDKVEPLSLDEAYLDVSGVQEHSNSATLIAQEIKKRIYNETGLTSSAGVAPNKLLAKIASDINKPNGLYVIKPNDVDDFIYNLHVKKLFGVGNVTQEKLKVMGIEYCYQLQAVSLDSLISKFGKLGSSLYQYSRGIDNREVNSERIRKSISVESTYLNDLKTLDECLEKVPFLYEKLCMRISDEYIKRISSIFIKITDTNFIKSSITKQVKEFNLDSFIFLLKDIYIKQTLPIRLLGIGVRLNEYEEKQLSMNLI
ncbi:DNA polymerase IV [Francisella frigiditurris]|uniref:DNA polymerase IV n=1 Tax=Francisella frigiditurris TaxID=1542390 RepID=A0A1J0KW52_9GAMM|nr:DNA polymerase IV [Francisella frigiditurris]APC97906.1 hypothetical protein KX01_991 [Francisella frigiditurris]